VIHELICRLDEAGGKQRQGCRLFAEALAAFRGKAWDEAIEKFHDCTEHFTEDDPSRFYISLCEGYRSNPPVEPWDGVVHMDSK
jgi:adenylate cyclase